MKKIILSQYKNKFKVAAGEEVLIIDDLSASANHQKNKQAFKIEIGPDCRVQYFCLISKNAGQDATLIREMIIGAGAKLAAYRLYLNPGETKQVFKTYLKERAEVFSRVFFYGRSSELLVAQDDYIFQAPGASGRFGVSGVLQDTASAKYFSDVIIEPLAQQTDSRIDMKLYLLNKGAKGSLLPGLQISANEVKAGHGASTFQLAPEEMFYLSSRGLSKSAIQNLIISSLTEQFLSGLDDKAAQDLVRREIKKRLPKNKK